jgi:hypothetical protein
MHQRRACAWVVTAFYSSVEDPREYLQTEYGGLSLHIKPAHKDEVNRVSVFLEDPGQVAQARLVINRFLSAMAWNDGNQYVTLGSIASGALLSDRDKPRFNYMEGRVLRYRITSEFDFEHLQNPLGQKQKLALALYREGLNSSLPLYRLLSFYKIINVGFGKPHEQMAWLNANLQKVPSEFGAERVKQLSATTSDIGEYLYVQGRTAIAHAYSNPIKDPDDPADVLTAMQDARLMHGLAVIFIRDELGVPSLNQIHREHLYELAGFKKLFGETLTARLKAGESIVPAEFPAIPPLSIGLRVQLRDGLRYECLNALPFRVVSCVAGIVILETNVSVQPIGACLKLNFPAEELAFCLERYRISRRLYSKAAEICYLRFLIDYFSNGYLRVFDASSGERSHKLAFLPINIDPGATARAWERRIAELETGMD